MDRKLCVTWQNVSPCTSNNSLLDQQCLIHCSIKCSTLVSAIKITIVVVKINAWVFWINDMMLRLKAETAKAMNRQLQCSQISLYGMSQVKTLSLPCEFQCSRYLFELFVNFISVNLSWLWPESFKPLVQSVICVWQISVLDWVCQSFKRTKVARKTFSREIYRPIRTFLVFDQINCVSFGF